MKAVKFGGTSLSSAESIYAVKRIIESDPDMRFIVVSAPGRTESEDKVTDILISVAGKKGEDRVKAFVPIVKRFNKLCDELNLSGALDCDLSEIESALPGADEGYIISRGEYLCAKLIARLIGCEFIDAADLIKFRGGAYDDKQTKDVCAERLSKLSCAVIPGFYGSDENGNIVTFPRGGSDITGAIVARAVCASLYENYTDVDGVMTCDPRIAPHAEPIDILTYDELRELAYMGANVLHPDSVFPVRKANIPIRIRNTFNPKALGTVIVPTEVFLSGRYEREKRSHVTAIAGKRHFYSLYIDKPSMRADVGFIRRVLNCFDDFDISPERVQIGTDSMTVVFSAQTRETADELIEAGKRELKPERISLTSGVSLIAIVGHGITSKADTAARAVRRLSSANINILMAEYTAAEISITIAVSDGDFERAIIALNGEFEV